MATFPLPHDHRAKYEYSAYAFCQKDTLKPHGRYPVSRETESRVMPLQLHLPLEFYLLPLPYTPLDLFSLFCKRSSFDTTDCFLFFHAALFALGNEPAFATNRTQHSTLDNFLAKALQQRVLRFA